MLSQKRMCNLFHDQDFHVYLKLMVIVQYCNNADVFKIVVQCRSFKNAGKCEI